MVLLHIARGGMEILTTDLEIVVVSMKDRFSSNPAVSFVIPSLPP